jgi:hypothetical protein
MEGDDEGKELGGGGESNISLQLRAEHSLASSKAG